MAIKKLQGLDAIRRWVVKTFLKEKEQTGVMVNLPKKDFVDLNTSITAERLMRNGIDPNSIKSEDQVENIINQLNKPRVVSQGDPEFEGIMSKVTGKNVIEANFGKPFKEEIINMREPKRFFKGVEIRDPKFDENLPFDNDAEKLAEIKMSNEAYEQELKKEIKKMKSDEEILSNIKKSNERSVQNLRMQMMDDKVANDMFQGGPSRDPKTDADMLAEFIAEDAGKIYDDLPTKERLKFYDRAYNAILRYKRKDPEDMADGGRIGYKLGTFKKIGAGLKSFAEFLNKKNPVQAYTDYLKSIKDKTLKANKTGKFTDLPLAEVGIPAAGGMLINRALKKKLEAMSEEDIERKKERDDKADGGRIGFKKGMDRRTFMKMVGGLTALPILGKLFKGAEIAAPVAEKAAEVASGAPPYFFNLVDRIRALGQKVGGPKERTESFLYKDYSMDIDLDTGAIEIKKTKEAMIPGGDEAGVAEEVYMTYKPGMADETTKGGKVVDEYEEFTARPDIDGKMKDVEDGVPDEVIEEGSIGKEQLEQEIVEQIARDKKASGGIAMMLGE